MTKSIIHVEWEQDDMKGGVDSIGDVSAKMTGIQPHYAKHVLAQILITMCEQSNDSVGLFLIHHMMSSEAASEMIVQEKK